VNKKFSENSDAEFQTLRDEWVEEARYYLAFNDVSEHRHLPAEDKIIAAINGLTAATLANMVTSRNGWAILRAIMNSVSISLRGLRH
jgi:hypothetical protein